MKLFHPTVVALALTAAFPAFAQTNAELLNELQALKARMSELEQKLQAQASTAGSAAAPAAAQAPAGMTPEQSREMGRVTVKAEAMEDAIEAQGLKMFKFSGFMDPTFIANQARQSASPRFLNNFAGGNESYTYDNSYFGMLGFDMLKEMDGGTRWHFTMAPHKSTGSNYNFPSLVHEATVSVPLDDLQTRLWAGQMPDWSGYEYFMPNQNKFITHNLLFDFAAPTYYTGAGLDLVRGKWMIKTMIGNMNANRYGDNRRSPVVSYRVDYAKGEFNGFGFAGQHGKVDSLVTARPERLNMFELDGYFIRGNLTAQAQVAVGQQANSAANGGDAQWWGLSTLAAYKVTPRFEISGRLDYLNNQKNGGGTLNTASGVCTQPERDGSGVLTGASVDGVCPDSANGFGPGMTRRADSGAWETRDVNRGTNRWALSLGASYLYTANTLFKTELRFDRADQDVFLYTGDGSYRRGNVVFGSSVMVMF